MNVQLHSVVYVSVSVHPLPIEQLHELLALSRERNKFNGITGMLIYKNGCFIQAFEGELQKVRDLQRRIARDPRHHNIVILRDTSIDERDFSSWTMGFKHLSDDDVAKQPGFSEMLKMLLHHGRNSVDTAFAIKLLKKFSGRPAEAA